MTNPYQTHSSHPSSKQSKHGPSKPNIEKLTFRKWYRTAIITYLIICLGAMIAIYLAEREIIHYDGPLPEFTLLMIPAIFYFSFLGVQFSWFSIIFFYLEFFIFILLILIFLVEKHTNPMMDKLMFILL